MTKDDPIKCFRVSREIICLAVMIYVCLPLSPRNVEDLLHERGIDISHDSVRLWWNRFGPIFAAETRRKRAERLHSGPQWPWHLDETFVKIGGERPCVFRKTALFFGSSASTSLAAERPQGPQVV